MAKYVCEFDMISDSAKKASKIANDMKFELDQMKTGINDDLSSWTGKSSSAFSANKDQIVNNMKKNIDCIIELANFLNNTVNEIQNAENELAAIKIYGG